VPARAIFRPRFFADFGFQLDSLGISAKFPETFLFFCLAREIRDLSGDKSFSCRAIFRAQGSLKGIFSGRHFRYTLERPANPDKTPL